jgi:hypothetical protein
MRDVVFRIIWFAIVACALAYMSLIFFGYAFATKASENTHLVIVQDDLQKGSHHLSGMVMVPSTCAELTLATNKISDHAYELAFETWNVPSVACQKEEVPRAFRTTLFAPPVGVDFIASLDGKPLTILVAPVVEQNN